MKKKRVAAYAAVLCMLLFLIGLQTLVTAAKNGEENEIVLNVMEYGVSSDGMRDNAASIQKAVAAAKVVSGTTDCQVILDFPKGEYHIYPDKAAVRELYISNTAGADSRYKMKTVGILLEDMENITIRGNGSLFMLHGRMMAFAALRCKGIRVENCAFDFYTPTVIDVTVESMEGNSVILHVPECYGYEISEGKTITWSSDVSPYTGKPYWTDVNEVSAYEQVYYTMEGRSANDVNRLFNGVVSIQELGNHRLQLNYRMSAQPRNLKAGNCYQMRRTVRDCAGMFFWKSKDIILKDLTVYFLHGAGITGQHSADITLDNVKFETPEGSGRVTAGYTEFVRMSGCRGKILVNGCVFSNSGDVPVNINGISNLVTERISARTFKVSFAGLRYRTTGFPNFFEGDKVRFAVQADMTAVSGSEAKIVNVTGPSGERGQLASGTGTMHEMLITLDRDILLEDDVQYVVENLTCTPEVEITNCIFKGSPAEGIRVSSGAKVLIQDNVFDGLGAASIRISGDTKEIFESGYLKNVVIERNTFQRPAAKESAISINPVIIEASESSTVYENISIKNNTFYVQNGRLLDAKCVKGLDFTGNRIYRWEPEATVELEAPDVMEIKGKGQLYAEVKGKKHSSELYAFERCREVTLLDNSYDGGLKLGGSTGGMKADEEIVQGAEENVDFKGNAIILPEAGDIFYEVQDEEILSVNYNGEITAQKAGSTRVRACTLTGGRKFVSVWKTIKVTEPAEEVLFIENGSVGETVQEHGNTVLYRAESASGDDEILWSIADASDGKSTVSCAEIDARTGELTTKSDGAIEILAKSGALEARKLLVVQKGNWLENKSLMENIRWRPNEWRILDGGGVRINAQSGGIYGKSKFDYVDNLYLSKQDSFSNVTALIKMGGRAKANGDEAGVVFYRDNGNYVALQRKNTKGNTTIQLINEMDDTVVKTEGFLDDIDADSIWLKLVKTGENVTGYCKASGKEDDADWIDAGWMEVCSYTDTGLGNSFRIGIMACNSVSGRGTPFEFSELKVKTGSGELLDYPLAYQNTAPEIRVKSCIYKDGALSVQTEGFFDADGDEPGIPIVRWEVADEEEGPYEMSGAVGAQGVNALEFAGRWVRAVVIPCDANGLYGAPVRSEGQQVGREVLNLPKSISLEGDSIINTYGEVKKYYAVLSPEGVNPLVKWKVVDAADQGQTDCAEIDAEGNLTVKSDGAIELVAKTAGGLEARKLVIINRGTKVPTMEILNPDRNNWRITGENQDEIEIKAQPSSLFKEQEGKNVFLYAPGGDMKKVEATVKMHGRTTGRWQEAGLIFYQGEDDYFFLGRKHANSNPAGKIKVTVEDDRKSDEWVYEGEGETAPDGEDLWFKLVKEGDTLDGLKAYYKTEEDGEWKERKFVQDTELTWVEDLKAKRPAIQMPLTDSFRIGFVTGGDSGVTWRDPFVFSDFKLRINDGMWQDIPLTEDNQAPSAVSAVCAYDAAAGEISAVLEGFFDANGDREGKPLVKWELSDSFDGQYDLIPAISGSRVILQDFLEGKWVRAVAVPRDEYGMYGEPVESAPLLINEIPERKASESALASAAFSGIGGMEEFDGGKKYYMGTAAQDVITAAFETKDALAAAEVYLNGRRCTSGEGTGEYAFDLAAGRNVVLVRVVAEDGVTQTDYRFALNRNGDSDSGLRAISLGNRNIPIISSNFTQENPYMAALEPGQESLAIAVTKHSEKAVVTIEANGVVKKGTETELSLKPGINDVVVRVRPETWVPETCYYVKVFVSSRQNADLAGLSFEEGVLLEEVFHASELNYTGTANAATAILTASAQEEDAEIEVFQDGCSLQKALGEVEQAVQMESGKTEIRVRVISPDKSAAKEYTLDIDGNGDTYIDFAPTSQNGEGEFRENLNYADGRIKLLMDDGTTRIFERGVGGCAGWPEEPMALEYNIADMGFVWFSAYLGIDQEAREDEASVRYRVYLDDKLIDDGGGENCILGVNTPAVFLDFDVTDAKVLRIEADGTGDGIDSDYISLGDAKFTLPMPGAVKKHTVKYQSDLQGRGLVEAQTGTKKTINGKIGVSEGETVTLTAGIREGYEFWAWYDEEGRELSGNPVLVISDVRETALYTARYVTTYEAARMRLSQALDEMENRINLSLYTRESVSRYVDIIEAVKRVLNSVGTDEEGLRRALERLRGAEKLLERKVESGGTIAPGTPAPKPPAAPALPAKGEKVKIGGSVYQVTKPDVKKGSVCLIKAAQKKNLVVPSEIRLNGYVFQVTEISKGACGKNKKLVRVTLGKNIKKIREKAFFGCSRLKKVIFQGKKAPAIGKKAFGKTAKKVVVTAKKIKKNARKKLLVNLKKKGGMSKKSTIK